LWRKLEEANPFAVAGLLAAIACLRTASNLAERYATGCVLQGYSSIREHKILNH
jgi:hypothetical protein